MQWTRGILLLACLWFASLAQNPAGFRDKGGSMNPDAVDDQYYGCTNDTELKAQDMLKQDLNGNDKFKEQWEKASEKWDELNKVHSFPEPLRKEYGTAVILYTDKEFHGDFKYAVQTFGRSPTYYKENFTFKAIHFYLTRALQILGKNATWKPRGAVYRGTKCRYTYSNSEVMRFGHFASTSSEKKIAERFGKTTFYTIETSFGVNITNLSHNASQQEVLIPVDEVFTVSPGEEGSNSYDLKSTGRNCSYLNCAYWDNPKSQECRSASASSGGISFHGQMRPSLLGGAVLLLHAAAHRLFAGA